MIQSPDNPSHHDGFLLEVERINTHTLGYPKREFPWYYENKDDEAIDEDFAIKCLGKWRWILLNGRYTHVNDFRRNLTMTVGCRWSI